ncbi:Phosphoglycerate dehydrogenase [Carnobacterium iners]|uniref:Phosphoglycerate dehydrogenase n=1 Tax=Carnobacterium iners TaxID=1073423 RepID=A0A1X7NAU0_9LACT|nr:NAD(P)-dependent oxidoreductase [Carnobacterium iners]SEL20277.1 Phosphoglycerate dehydrogenase [Carnobacterium iners]SMH33902.1 Phosphoglycerate dehydrogenase [Carnobacterium iners]
MIKLLLTGAFKYSQEQLDNLEGLGYEIIFIQDERVSINIDVSNIEVVVCNSLFLYNNISKFKNLKVIQLTSAGMDRVPLDYINKNKIKVFNANDVYSIPIAEWVVLKVLETYKMSKFFYKNQEIHEWTKRRDLLELTNKTASIIGFGNVGREVAKRLKAFGVKIIGVDRKEIESEYFDECILIKDSDKALEKSDIIILTLPLTKETRSFINKDTIKMMKDNVVLVNVARGGLINEAELITALNEGKFLGVALDVFQEEPLRESRLWDFENVIITPHNSFVSDRIDDRLFNLIAENLNSNLIHIV